MPFDFQALLDNPQFQFGATLLGGGARQPNAVGNAYTQMAKLRELKQQQALQQAQIQDMAEQRRIQQAQYERLNSQTQMQLQAEQRKMDMQNKFMEQLQGMGILGGGAGQQPQGAPQPPQQGIPTPLGTAPQGGASGITPQLLDNLAQVESSGNPAAVNPESGAQGLMQFMPATTAMMRRTDPSFDPFNPTHARAKAADYLQSLTAQHGGDLRAALAAYGGFKKKDPTAYLQKVLGTTGAAQPSQGAGPGSPIPVAGSIPNTGLDVARLAAGAGVAGVPGAAQLMELGKLLAPQNVPGNSYQRDPATGAMQYIQDPMSTARLGQDAQRINMESQRVGMDAQRLGIEQRKQAYEQGNHPGELPQRALDAVNQQRYETANTEIQKSLVLYKELPSQLGALTRAQADVASLVKNKTMMTPIGFGAATKLTALKAFKNIFGYDAPKSVADAEDFNSAMAQLWMKAVKQVDQNPTANQQKSIMASFGTLQNDPAALTRILAETRTSFVKQMQHHNRAVAQFTSKVGPDPFSRYLDPGTRTPAGTTVGAVEDGYTYLGGDPADPNSWTK